MSRTLVWLRQDLRLKDNPALYAAAQQGQVLLVYIQDKIHCGERQLGAASNWWLHQSLEALSNDVGGELLLASGDPNLLIPELCREYDCQAVYWNRCYQPWQIQRDKLLKQSLQQEQIQVQSFNGSLLWEPWQVLKGDGSPYKVFTPYYRKGCLLQQPPRLPLPKPDVLDLITPQQNTNSLSQLALMPEIHWYQQIEQSWQPGEQGAGQRLSDFISAPLSQYKAQRDKPAISATSGLSPHLRFGEISPNQVWYASIDSLRGNLEDIHLDCFLSELGWREFSYYLLYHFPQLPQKNFQPKFDHFPWQANQNWLQAWQKGQTGIPIVDAGMRELWQTGSMHNRVRMITASFLVKNLLQDWREGEQWFWDCLLDADLASNSASWQWVAGSGADAAPYFRIFNPVTQGQKFDPQGQYVKRYCPELRRLPDKYIHNPWEADKVILKACGIELGQEYPKPLVDLKQSRQKALDAFASIKGVS